MKPSLWKLFGTLCDTVAFHTSKLKEIQEYKRSNQTPQKEQTKLPQEIKPKISIMETKFLPQFSKKKNPKNYLPGP